MSFILFGLPQIEQKMFVIATRSNKVSQDHKSTNMVINPHHKIQPHTTFCLSFDLNHLNICINQFYSHWEMGRLEKRQIISEGKILTYAEVYKCDLVSKKANSKIIPFYVELQDEYEKMWMCFFLIAWNPKHSVKTKKSMLGERKKWYLFCFLHENWLPARASQLIAHANCCIC